MSCSLIYRDLVFEYPDGTKALNGIDLRTGHGDHVALLGPNGAGKSTLMLHTNGILSATSGEIEVGHVLLTKETLTQIRQRVGLVFQDPDDQLFMTTVRDDVAFGPLNMGLSEAEVDARVHEALAAVGLDTEEIAAKPGQELSFGQKKRVALATVLSMRPDILVLDEPTSNLDPKSRRQMIELLARLDATVLIATHDMDVVWELCPRSVIIDDGRVVADGPTQELLRDEALLLAHGLELPSQIRYAHPHTH